MDINAKDKTGWTALHCLCYNLPISEDEEEKFFKELVSFPGIIVDVENDDQVRYIKYSTLTAIQ